MLSPPKQIPVTSLLFNATSDHFFNSKMKKKLVKNNNYKTIQGRDAKKHKEQIIKNKRLSDYIYSIAKMCIKARQFIKS